MQEGPNSPLTRCKTTRTSHKRRKHNPTLMQRFHLGAEAETDRDITRTTGEGCEIPPPSPRFFALRWRRMLSLPVQQRGTGRREHINKHTYHETTPAAELAPPLDGLCRKGSGILPLQCQKVTLRPVPDSASTPSRCAQRGGAPRHRRASGGVAQRLPSNGGQNQAVKKKKQV